jgi:hypothetical protein|tara:strand:+ start:3179 stop:3325 length:147 start_codon:yes stop_codon:yes gene_type:complete
MSFIYMLVVEGKSDWDCSALDALLGVTFSTAILISSLIGGFAVIDVFG